MFFQNPPKSMKSGPMLFLYKDSYYFCTRLCLLGPQNGDFRGPSKFSFFKKGTLEGPGSAKQLIKKLVLPVTRALWGTPWPRPCFAFRFGFNRINENKLFLGPLWAPVGRPNLILLYCCRLLIKIGHGAGQEKRLNSHVAPSSWYAVLLRKPER